MVPFEGESCGSTPSGSCHGDGGARPPAQEILDLTAESRPPRPMNVHLQGRMAGLRYSINTSKQVQGILILLPGGSEE